MVVPLIFIRIDEQPPWEELLAKHPEMIREANREMGAEWAEKMLPLHFKPEAHERYHYQERKPSTKKRKLQAAAKGRAIMEGTVDDVWSGLFMRAALGYQQIDPTTHGVTVRAYGPKYIGLGLHRAGDPDIAAETTTVTEDEMRELASTLDGTYQKQVDAQTATKSTDFGHP